MSTDTGADGDDATDDDAVTTWSDAQQRAAVDVERRCGIALVPGGLED